MWEIRPVICKGLGVFATRFIPRGTRIFSEQPLLYIQQNQTASDIYAASQLISAACKQELLQLSANISKESAVIRWNQAFLCILIQRIGDTYAKLCGATVPGSRKSSIREHVTINSIFRTNAFNLGSASLIQHAVFPRISRINHSCVPNSQGNFHEKLGKFNIHATRDIDVDEELTLNYLPEVAAVRGTRQRILMSGFGFECTCPACDMTMERGRRGEERRASLQKLLETRRGRSTEGKWYNSDGSEDFYSQEVPEYKEQDPAQELRTVEAIIEMLEGEDIAGRELSTLYFEAAKLYKTLQRPVEALRFAEKGLDIEKDCLGVDSPLYQNSLQAIGEMKSAT